MYSVVELQLSGHKEQQHQLVFKLQDYNSRIHYSVLGYHSRVLSVRDNAGKVPVVTVVLIIVLICTIAANSGHCMYIGLLL